MCEAAEQGEDGFSLAGLAQVGDASCRFGLFTAQNPDRSLGADVLRVNETPIIDSSGVRDRPGHGRLTGSRSID